MNLSLVTETYPPELNGVAMTLGQLVSHLRRRGNHVQVVRPRQNIEDHPAFGDNLREVLMPGMPLPGYQGLRLGLPCRRHLRRLWRSERPDLVHIATEGPLGWSALREALRSGIPTTSSFHTNFHSYGRHYGFGLLKQPVFSYLRYLHNRTQITFAPTEHLCARLQNDGFRNLAVLGRGVDASLYDPARKDIELRTQWLNKDSAKGLVVLYVGRIAAEKNIELAIRAYAKMRDAGVPLRFVLVGDGPLRSKLENKYPDFVFCGAKSGTDLARHYASADLFLFPSLTETYGNVVVEAMASGVTVVSFDYAAAAQHVSNGVNGLTVQPGNDAAFINAAVEAVTDRGKLMQMGRRARQTVLSLGWESVTESFENKIRQIAFPKKRSGTVLKYGDILP